MNNTYKYMSAAIACFVLSISYALARFVGNWCYYNIHSFSNVKLLTIGILFTIVATAIVLIKKLPMLCYSTTIILNAIGAGFLMGAVYKEMSTITNVNYTIIAIALFISQLVIIMVINAQRIKVLKIIVTLVLILGSITAQIILVINGIVSAPFEIVYLIVSVVCAFVLMEKPILGNIEIYKVIRNASFAMYWLVLVVAITIISEGECTEVLFAAEFSDSESGKRQDESGVIEN